MSLPFLLIRDPLVFKIFPTPLDSIDGLLGSRGLYLMPKAKLLQNSGSMIFRNCTAGKDGAGGGLSASGRNVLQVSGGQMFFEDCRAKDGGGIKIKGHGKIVT